MDLKFTILRRAIQYGKTVIAGGVCLKTYTIEELKTLCRLIEGKSAKQLKEIHKQWIGY